MGLFDLFKSKPTKEQTFLTFRDQLLSLYGVNNPSDAQRFKCTMALTIAAIGVINDVSAGTTRTLIDEISDVSYKLCESLRFKVSDISDDEDFVSEVLSHIPGGGSPNVTVNGGLMFPAYFNYFGPGFVKDICDKNGGPMGSFGSAAIIVGQVSINDSRKSFMEVTFLVTEFVKTILK